MQITKINDLYSATGQINIDDLDQVSENGFKTIICFRPQDEDKENQPNQDTLKKEAKKRGMKWYNFWGIAPDDAPASHPFKGITHFKKGFGGEEKQLLHCQDMPLSWKYWINWFIETVRSKKRGF